jgi:hypothetical protein
MGSSVYKYVSAISGSIDNIPNYPGFFELRNFNRDVLSAYDLSLKRLVMDAEALGADAVIGLTLRRREMEGGAIEVMFTGTAVAFPLSGAEKRYGVLTSFLPGQDFGVLLENGYLPVRAVISSSICAYVPDYYEHLLIEGGQSFWAQAVQGTVYNEEIKGLTEACATVYRNLRRRYAMILDDEVPGHTLMGVKVNFEREEFLVNIPSYDFLPGSNSNEVEAVGSYLLVGTLTGTLVARVNREQPCSPVLPVLWLKD